MDRLEAASIILDCISRSVVLRWDDCQAVAAAVDEALVKIELRRQEAGPEVMKMKRPRCGNTKGQKKKHTPIIGEKWRKIKYDYHSDV